MRRDADNYSNHFWNLMFMKLVYAGREIEPGAAADARLCERFTGNWRSATMVGEEDDRLPMLDESANGIRQRRRPLDRDGPAAATKGVT